MNLFNMSLAWKLFSGLVLIVFIFVGIILTFMKIKFMAIIEVEAGVISTWLAGILVYGILVYLIRRTKRL